MKHLFYLIVFLFLTYGQISAQTVHGFAEEFLLLHQPDARAEAMGRGNAAVTGHPFQILFNPAASSFAASVDLDYTYLDPDYPGLRNNSYYAYGVNLNSGRYGAIGFNYFRYAYENWIALIDLAGNDAISGIDEPQQSEMFSLNYSYKFVNGFAVGATANYFAADFYYCKSNSFTFDLGVLKQFTLSEGKYPQSLSAAASISNIFGRKLSQEYRDNSFRNPFNIKYSDFMPALMRAAGAYELIFNPHELKRNPLSVLLTAEYQNAVNHKYYNSVKFGLELTALEILKIRAGQYSESLNDGSRKDYEKSISGTTWGIGLRLPIYKASKSLPFEVNIDYAWSENPVYYIPQMDEYKSYSLFTINLKTYF